MIEPDERKKLDKLRTRMTCPKRFACLDSCLTDLCESKYHIDLDILECLDKSEIACKFARSFGGTVVCACPLRRFIAKNFDKWSVESTAILKHTGN